MKEIVDMTSLKLKILALWKKCQEKSEDKLQTMTIAKDMSNKGLWSKIQKELLTVRKQSDLKWATNINLFQKEGTSSV